LCLVAVLAAVPAAGHPLKEEAPVTEPVRWSSGDVTLVGTLYRPATPGPHPAAIFIHGSGTMGRSSDILREHAMQLSSRGLAMLIYDKRGVGESSGRWQEASFEDLARDAVGGIDLLRAQPGIDAARVGVFGLSQGSWISLRVAALRPQVAFIAWVTGAAVTPARQEEHVVSARLRARGMDEHLGEALALLRLAQEVYRTDAGWERLAALDAASASRPWYDVARVGVAKRADTWWRWYAGLMDDDPRPALTTLKVPLFAAFAGADELVDSDESIRVIETTVPEARRTIRRYPGHRHAFRDQARRFAAPDGYWEELTAFLALPPAASGKETP
jgi:dienelactone hydrolase